MPNEWQAIDTAPRDGTRVLIGRFTGNPKADKEGFCQVDWFRTDYAKNGFTGFGKFNERYWPATHWMPLPPPPSGD